MKVEISFNDESREDVISLLEESGAEKVTPVEGRGFADGGLVILAVLAVSALVNLIIKLLPLWKCGMIVDARLSPVSAQKNCDLPRGTLLLIHPDGAKVTIDRPTELDLKILIGAIASAKA